MLEGNHEDALEI